MLHPFLHTDDVKTKLVLDLRCGRLFEDGNEFLADRLAQKVVFQVRSLGKQFDRKHV